MEMYTNNDLALFEENIDDIKKKLVQRENEILEPTFKQRKEWENMVFDFLRASKRKIYGGFAANKLITIKNPEDAFYDVENEIADIDFYSPEPVEDIIKLSNLFFDKGFKNIEGKQAQHEETYTVFVEFIKVADISYVPKSVYHRITFVEINGLNYVSPSFIMIDMYRILTDPLTSGLQRWEKTFPRIFKLQKHYPFNKATAKLPNIYKNKYPNDDGINKIMKTTFDFIKNNKSVILYGDYAYNCFLNASGITKSKDHAIFQPLEIMKYEMVSTNYREDAKALIKLVKEKHPDLADYITISEFYPFWTLTGYSCEINYKDYPFVNITHYNRRCVPTKHANNVQIGSFDYTFLMNLIYTLKYRVQKDNDNYQYRNIMTSHLIAMRNYYFKTSKKNFLDDTLFQEFIVECTGETIEPRREAFLLIKEKKDKKKLIKWSYSPEKMRSEPTSLYKFANTSGNIIRNPKNFRILDLEIIKPTDRTTDREGQELPVDEPVEEELPEDIIRSSLARTKSKKN